MPARERKYIFTNIDWWMVLMYLVLVGIGWISVYASGYSETAPRIFDVSMVYGKQMIWIGIAFFLAFLILIIDAKFFSTFAYFIYAITMLLLVVVLIIGTEVHASRSWLVISESIRFQPAEIAKFATALALAKYLSDSSIRITDWSTRKWVAVILGIPILLIVFQNETGSMLVFFSFIFVLYREGLSSNVLIFIFLLIVLFLLTLLLNKLIIIIALAVIAAALIFFVRRTLRNILIILAIFGSLIGVVFSIGYAYERILKPHQRKRIDVLLGKEVDPKGAGYNVNQSIIAIGSGGVIGKGFLNGTQTKFKFVPEQNTDFIFCTVGEEWGFAGSLLVLAIYILLLLRIIQVAERQRSAFSRIYGYGLASVLFFHVIINIGMTIGLAPVVGIPLPFISYGGSSMLAFSIMLFVFIKQDAVRMQVL
jgi:rod shape determining protein RodA